MSHERRTVSANLWRERLSVVWVLSKVFLLRTDKDTIARGTRGSRKLLNWRAHDAYTRGTVCSSPIGAIAMLVYQC